MLAVINLLLLFIPWNAPLGHLRWEGCVVSLITALHYFCIWMNASNRLITFAYYLCALLTQDSLCNEISHKLKKKLKVKSDQSAGLFFSFKTACAVIEHRCGYFFHTAFITLRSKRTNSKYSVCLALSTIYLSCVHSSRWESMLLISMYGVYILIMKWVNAVMWSWVQKFAYPKNTVKTTRHLDCGLLSKE